MTPKVKYAVITNSAVYGTWTRIRHAEAWAAANVTDAWWVLPYTTVSKHLR